MNLTRGTRNLLVALTVAGSALAAPAAALAETPAPDEPIGPDDVANPTENPDPDPGDLPGGGGAGAGARHPPVHRLGPLGGAAARRLPRGVGQGGSAPLDPR